MCAFYIKSNFKHVLDIRILVSQQFYYKLMFLLANIKAKYTIYRVH